MKNKIMLVASLFTILQCNVNNVYAGEYAETGYINFVKSNYDGYCFLELPNNVKPGGMIKQVIGHAVPEIIC